MIYDNSADFVDPEGEVTATYCRVHLRSEERLALRTGYRFVTGEPSFGAGGLLIVWDLAFSEAGRCLALQGAEVVCVCANWERLHVTSCATMLTRAMENSLSVVAANRTGEEQTYSFFGGSLIAGPRGKVHSATDERAERCRLGTIDLDEVRKTREDI